MIWREATLNDTNSVLELTREPMGGGIQLIWGLNELRAPNGCDHFKAHCIETQNEVAGCVLSWNWPDDSRYLGGLRFGQNMPTRPRPRFWKNAFESLLSGVNYAWTCIGAENHRARRMLESDVNWLPTYTRRQKITTWFIPIASNRRHCASKNQPIDEAHWRHVAVASGKGLSYRIGRAMDRVGLPGVPAPMKPIRLAYYHPTTVEDIQLQRKLLNQINGYDAVIVVLPTDSQRAKQWAKVVPRIHWKWSSALYTVSWNKLSTDPKIPNWKGLWL